MFILLFSVQDKINVHYSVNNSSKEFFYSSKEIY